MGSEEVGRRARLDRQDEPVCNDGAIRGLRGPSGGRPGAGEALHRALSPDLDAAGAQLRLEALDEGAHAMGECPEHRWPVLVGGRRRRADPAERAHQPAALGRGREEQWEHGSRAHVGDRSAVDPTDQRIDESVDDAATQPARHERAEGPVAEWAPAVGPGCDGVAEQARRAGPSEDSGTGHGPPARWHPEHQSRRQWPEPAPCVDGGARCADRHQLVAQPQLTAQPGGLGPPTEEGVRTDVDHATPEELRVQRAAEPRERLEDGDRRCVGVRALTPG